ncbi:hypothetical protein CQY20_18380 [Mycolicibacterium agri]|uniref:Uncharacterized protein n=2 Tax=Mycolicibacterium agri TaxID=36811 RepID=A0A2A7MZG9_MYCAG|nr:hypothetical protein CQY20_18380 [Mycolicibacterium agri]
MIAGLVGSMLTMAPVANAAEPLAEIRGTVTKDRVAAGCEEMKYNPKLQDIAFAVAQMIPAPQHEVDAMIGAYRGDVRTFVGMGDPMAAAVNDAYRKGAGPAITDCYWTEYGVSFLRYEEFEEDYVGIVVGRPGVTTPPSGPGAPGGGAKPPEQQAPAPPPPPVKCPPGGPKTEVPAGETCPPPTNAIRVTFDRGIGFWTVNVKNEAGIGGKCTYRATSTTGLTGASRDFDIAPNGTASFSVPAPLPLTTYEVVTSCTGEYDGKQVEFGRDVQTVSL